jgi:hypothetical protein
VVTRVPLTAKANRRREGELDIEKGYVQRRRDKYMKGTKLRINRVQHKYTKAAIISEQGNEK